MHQKLSENCNILKASEADWVIYSVVSWVIKSHLLIYMLDCIQVSHLIANIIPYLKGLEAGMVRGLSR